MSVPAAMGAVVDDDARGRACEVALQEEVADAPEVPAGHVDGGVRGGGQGVGTRHPGPFSAPRAECGHGGVAGVPVGRVGPLVQVGEVADVIGVRVVDDGV